MNDNVWTEFYSYDGTIIYLEQIYTMLFGWGNESGFDADFYCNLKFAEAEDDKWLELHFTGDEAIELVDRFRKLKAA